MRLKVLLCAICCAVCPLQQSGKVGPTQAADSSSRGAHPGALSMMMHEYNQDNSVRLIACGSGSRVGFRVLGKVEA
jgi:hypothetical protein